jgi:hypothetical protein
MWLFDVLLLKWCDVYIMPFLDFGLQFCIRFLLCGVQFCCMQRGFFCTSRNVVIGVCVVSCVLHGSVDV